MSKGQFFAITREGWSRACELGLNPAVAYLVQSCGTGRDNVTTSWSAEAVANYSGMSWRRAKTAIETLVSAGETTQSGSRTRPKYKIHRSKKDEDLIWLPNALVTAASDESPPIYRLRQTRELEVLQTFIELYGEQDLAGDGGIPRRLLYQNYERSKIMDMGQFVVYGFTRPEQIWCRYDGPLARFRGRKEGTAWERLNAMQNLGLIEWVHYLAEDSEHDAELIHALDGDEHAEEVAECLSMATECLPGGFDYEAELYDVVVPVIRHIERAAVVTVARLRYRPRTSLTSAWYARHVESSREFADLYRRIARGELRAA